MNDVLKVAFVGCGRVARHYRFMHETGGIPHIRVVACCDTDYEKAADMAAYFKAKPYSDYAQMLADGGYDAVAILTPSGLHFEHATLALKHQYHALVEKPLCLLPEQGEQLVIAAKKSQRLLNVMFQNRFNPAIIQLREAWLAGRFGNLVTATIRLRWCRYQEYYEDGWHGTWAMDGGVINQQAIHHLDVLDWICGPIESVCAAEGNRANILEAEDTLVACVKFRNGALGTIEATTAARPKDYEASLSVVGDKGTVVIGGIALNKVEMWDFVSPSREDATVRTACSQEVPSGYGLSHGPLLEEIASRICSGSSVLPVPAEEGMRTVSLVHALYASVEKGGWVSLRDMPTSVRLGVRP